MAIQIQNSHQYTNGSGFLPGGSRENSQASQSHHSKATAHGPQFTGGSSNQKSTAAAINIAQVNTHASNAGNSSTRNSSQNNDKT
jgi:hypothetical protein